MWTYGLWIISTVVGTDSYLPRFGAFPQLKDWLLAVDGRLVSSSGVGFKHEHLGES